MFLKFICTVIAYFFSQSFSQKATLFHWNTNKYYRDDVDQAKRG